MNTIDQGINKILLSVLLSLIIVLMGCSKVDKFFAEKRRDSKLLLLLFPPEDVGQKYLLYKKTLPSKSVFSDSFTVKHELRGVYKLIITSKLKSDGQGDIHDFAGFQHLKDVIEKDTANQRGYNPKGWLTQQIKNVYNVKSIVTLNSGDEEILSDTLFLKHYTRGRYLDGFEYRRFSIYSYKVPLTIPFDKEIEFIVTLENIDILSEDLGELELKLFGYNDWQ